MDASVAIFIFNRPLETSKVFSAIAAARPRLLFVIADGPRPERRGEHDLCQKVRAITEQINWPCEIERDYAPENLGCAKRIVTGLDWVFGLVESCIILEDDCLPNPSFFPFCSELLMRYRDDSRIGMISGNNFIHPQGVSSSYYFSQVYHTTGWATWRRAWKCYDHDLKNWPAIKGEGLLKGVFDDAAVYEYWCRIFDRMQREKPEDIWDYQWFYTNLIQHAVAAVPTINLVQHIGTGPDATHGHHESEFWRSRVGEMKFPLRHPSSLLPMRNLDRVNHRVVYVPTLLMRIKAALRDRLIKPLR